MSIGNPLINPNGTPGMFFIYNSWGGGSQEAGTAYNGPVEGVNSQLLLGAPTGAAVGPSALVGQTSTLEVTAETPDTFIMAGSGFSYCSINDAGSTAGGNNVLDACAGSDFLTGGSGNNQFYLDARNLSVNQWDTIADAHTGDGITIWGVTPQDFALTWLNGQGAAGATGLTGVFTANGTGPAFNAEVGITLAGLSQADLASGHLTTSYGTTNSQPGAPGSTYFHIQVN